MHPYPSIPSLDSAPDELLDGGHLWIQELIDADLLRFRIDDSGGLQFGDRSTVFQPGEAPMEYRYATRFVERSLEYEAALSVDLDGVVFYCVATHERTVPYDWDRIPPVLGIDVWDGEQFLPPDAVEQAFERLGLSPVNTFAKEVRADDFDPESYTIPESNWYEGQAYGVVVRSKTGGRATMYAPDWQDPHDGSVDRDPVQLAAEFASNSRLERITQSLSDRGQPVSADTLFNVAFEELVRQHHRQLFDSTNDADISVCRSELSAGINQFLDDG